MDSIPQQYLSKSPVRDNAVINLLAGNVPNPFKGLIPNSTALNGSTVPLSQLLVPFPQYPAGSGGSNKGPTNPDYLKDVTSRIDSFLVHNKSVNKSEIPSELVTASGSGLDPDISRPAAYVQITRVAKTRGMREEDVRAIVEKHIEGPLFGLMGTEKINVLSLNIDLDQATKK